MLRRVVFEILVSIFVDVLCIIMVITSDEHVVLVVRNSLERLEVVNEIAVFLDVAVISKS